MRTSRVAVLVALTLLLTSLGAACSGDDDTSTTTTTRAPATTTTTTVPAAVLDCRHVIGTVAAPPPGFTTLRDAAAFPTDRVLQAEPDDRGGFFAKTGLVVRAGVVVDVTVVDETAGRAEVGWGSPAVPARHVRVPACPATEPWIAFAGGYFVTTPACVTVGVDADGGHDEARVAVGTRCVP
jgi:hypothetical protein